jgi:hypothetical protein
MHDLNNECMLIIDCYGVVTNKFPGMKLGKVLMARCMDLLKSLKALNFRAWKEIKENKEVIVLIPVLLLTTT